MYLAAVERAVSRPGGWVEIPRDFVSEANASVTAGFLEQGYLRVEPREGDVPVVVQGKRYIRTAAPVETRRRQVDDEWRRRIGSRGCPLLPSREQQQRLAATACRPVVASGTRCGRAAVLGPTSSEG